MNLDVVRYGIGILVFLCGLGALVYMWGLGDE